MSRTLVLTIVFFASFMQVPHGVAQTQGVENLIPMAPKIVGIGDWMEDPKAPRVHSTYGDLPVLTPAIWHGSGLVVSRDGLIVTNRHVVEDAVSLIVMFPNTRRGFLGTVVHRDSTEDLAFLVVDVKDVPAFNLTNSAPAKYGEGVLVLGYPSDILQREPALTQGNVARMSKKEGGRMDLQITAPVSHGNSGGPVFDSTGRMLLGIVYQTRTDSQNYNLAIPAKTVVESFNDMKMGNNVDRARRGFGSSDSLLLEEYGQVVFEIITGNKEAFPRLLSLGQKGFPEALLLSAGVAYMAALDDYRENKNVEADKLISKAKELARQAVKAKPSLKTNILPTTLEDIGGRIPPHSVPDNRNQSISTNTENNRPPPPPPRAWLRIHGSNTIGAELAPALIKAFLEARGATSTVVRNGIEPSEKIVEGQLNGTVLKIEIQAKGSGTAFSDLRSGDCDVGMASRKINEKEIAELSTVGDMTSPQCEHVIGLDGIAIIVPPMNPLSSISTEWLARIFSGEVRDWAQVPGSGSGPISVYARDEKSGTFDTFKHLVLDPRKLKLFSGAKRYESNNDLSDNVSTDSSAIGFVSLPSIRNSKALKVMEPGAVEKFPTVFTVKTEDYPLTRRLYFYTPGTPKQEAAAFVQFAKSDAGQKIVDATGFVGQIPIPITDPPSFTTEKYRRAILGAQRQSMNFRFKSGSFELDTKAKPDVGRLISLMSQPDNRGRKLLLFGFADSIGKKAANCNLSEKRAEKVAEELRAYGLNATEITGFCDDMPVGSNETEEGRARNRRVEVWLR